MDQTVSSAPGKAGKIRYTKEPTQYLDIYLPQHLGYLWIQMNFVDSRETNAYGWRLHMMYACDDSLHQRFPITNLGEYETAIHLIDRPDFMGMGAHGSEQMTSFCIFVDEAETSLDVLRTLTEWNSIHICRESRFFDPLDEVTHVANHSVVYDFDLFGLTVTQTVDWLAENTCVRSYMMMFPVRREFEGMQITDTYSDDCNPGQYDVSQADFSGYPGLWIPGVTEMTLCSPMSGVTATMKRLENPALPGGGYRFCWNAAAYNKMYFTVCGAENESVEVVPGDRWCTKHRYEVILV